VPADPAEEKTWLTGHANLHQRVQHDMQVQISITIKHAMDGQHCDASTPTLMARAATNTF
jgi:hypothetical protein